jgi:hypothetical protein
LPHRIQAGLPAKVLWWRAIGEILLGHVLANGGFNSRGESADDFVHVRDGLIVVLPSGIGFDDDVIVKFGGGTTGSIGEQNQAGSRSSGRAFLDEIGRTLGQDARRRNPGTTQLRPQKTGKPAFDDKPIGTNFHNAPTDAPATLNAGCPNFFITLRDLFGAEFRDGSGGIFASREGRCVVRLSRGLHQFVLSD